jgi:hypothetical protein
MQTGKKTRRIWMKAAARAMCYDMEAKAENIKRGLRPSRMSQHDRDFIALKARQTIDRMNEIIAKVGAA